MPTHGSSLFNTIFLPNSFPRFFYRLLLTSQKIASSQKCRKFCHQVQLTNLEGRDFRKYIIASFAIYLRYTGILRPISATSRPLLLWHHPLSIEIGIFTRAKWKSFGPTQIQFINHFNFTSGPLKVGPAEGKGPLARIHLGPSAQNGGMQKIKLRYLLTYGKAPLSSPLDVR